MNFEYRPKVQSNIQIDLSNKVALVTGAASGIGHAISKRLAYSGAKVCMVDIQEYSPDPGSFGLQENWMTVVTDLASPESVAKMHSEVTSTFGKVDILINNAGLQHVDPLENFPLEKWNEMMDVMLRAAFLNTQYVLPSMVRNGWGRIINLASIHAVVASPFKAAYISAKHGLVGLTKASAVEVATKNITVNAISPSYVSTPLVEKQIEKLSQIHQMSYNEVTREIMLVPMPQKELIDPDEIAEVVLFFCSDAARHINGHNLVIDGGWTIK